VDVVLSHGGRMIHCTFERMYTTVWVHVWKARCVRVTTAHDMLVMRRHRSIANHWDIVSNSVSKTHLPRQLPFYSKHG
jgi:hypothetical protein